MERKVNVLGGGRTRPIVKVEIDLAIFQRLGRVSNSSSAQHLKPDHAPDIHHALP